MRACHRAACVLVLLAGCARWSDKRDMVYKLQGGAFMHYELTGVTRADHLDTPAAAPRDLVLAGARLHGFVGGGKTIGLHGGIDLAAGSTLRGAGFAYDVALLPLGIAVRFGRSSFVALGTGVGAMGAVGTLDDAVTLPVEATLEAGKGIRVLARARASYVAGAAGRHDGARNVPFADELDAMLALRIGHHYEDYGYPSGNGYFVGVAYRELLDSRWIGATIGYSIDLGTPR
ncbi:MAG: hypothetical protein JO257_18480 [Deltaproteobacteria bacterium]|nr:hypothetical protein [Deltaproteobacteria bacterium]